MLSEHLSLEIIVARHRGHQPNALPRVEMLREMVQGMDEQERKNFLGSLLTSPPLEYGAPVPGCSCPSCTGLPANHPARIQKPRGRSESWERLVEDARSRPVLDVARELGMEPRKAGKEWVARCPFHEDKTPSLFLTPSKGLWHCFGCGRGGDGIALVKAVRGLDFLDAVRELAA